MSLLQASDAGSPANTAGGYLNEHRCVSLALLGMFNLCPVVQCRWGTRFSEFGLPAIPLRKKVASFLTERARPLGGLS